MSGGTLNSSVPHKGHYGVRDKGVEVDPGASHAHAHEGVQSARGSELASRPVSLSPVGGSSGTVEAGMVVVAPSAVSLSADELVARWLLQYSGATRDAYGRDVRDFCGVLASWGVGLLSTQKEHVDAYARLLEEQGRARSTVARRLAALSSFFRYCVDEDVIGRSPVRGRRPRSGGESPHLGLSEGQVRDFLAAAERSGPRDHALACLLALNGLRVSEALSVDVDGLDTERGHRVVTIARKGGRRVRVPLSPRAAAAVDALVAYRAFTFPDDGPLFVTRGGKRLDRHAAKKVVARLARDAGIAQKVSPHSLRHSFVTIGLDAGVSLRDMQDAAGHADPRTTRRYDRARHNLDRAATYTVAAALG